ncbi:MAG: hypothetical protein K6B43_10705 [Treponema sp.]|nr:hypothetical protein [Treponema sp.]
MKRIFNFLLLLLCFFIFGCTGDIKLNIYTRDLSDVASSRENVIYTNANLIVESLTKEEDIDFLRNNLNGFSNEKVIEYNYSDSLSFDIKIPIIRNGTDLDFSKDLMFLIATSNEGKTDYYLKYNKGVVSRIDNYFYETHYQNIDLSNFKIKLEINNDERKNVLLTTYSCYVDGKSYPFSHDETLSERDRISIEVSEIFSKSISSMDNIDYPLFSIK